MIEALNMAEDGAVGGLMKYRDTHIVTVLYLKDSPDKFMVSQALGLRE